MKAQIEAFIAANGGSVRKATKAFVSATIASTFVRNVVQSLGTRVFAMILTLGTSVLVTRALGPKGRGELAVVTALAGLGMQFGNLGLHSANNYFAARSPNLTPALLGNSVLISLSLGTAIALVLGAAVYWYPHLIAEVPLSFSVIVLGVTFVPIGLLCMLLQNLLLGRQQIWAYNFLEILNRALILLLTALILVTHTVTVSTALATLLVAASVVSTVAVISIRRHCTLEIQYSRQVMIDCLRYGMRAYFVCFLVFLMGQLGLFFVSRIDGAVQAGYFSVALFLFNLCYLIPTVIGTILFPRLVVLSNTRAKWAMVRRILALYIFGLPIIFGVLVLCAKPMILTLYGPQFLPAINPFLILTVAAFFTALNSPLDYFVASVGIPAWNLYYWGIGCVFHFLLTWQLVTHMGMLGAACANAVTYFLLFGTQYLLIKRKLLHAN